MTHTGCCPSAPVIIPRGVMSATSGIIIYMLRMLSIFCLTWMISFSLEVKNIIQETSICISSNQSKCYCNNISHNISFIKWWGWQDSNLQPSRYERPALTIELHPQDRLRKQPISSNRSCERIWFNERNNITHSFDITNSF